MRLSPKANNPATVKKAIALGKEVRKQPEKTKADAARAMFELISGEPREIVVQAFIDGASSRRRLRRRTSTKRKAKKAA